MLNRSMGRDGGWKAPSLCRRAAAPVTERRPALPQGWRVACAGALLAAPLSLLAADVTNGLVLGYGFERLDEGLVTDSSPSAIHGVPVGNPVPPLQAPSLYAHGQAFSFDSAQQQYVRVPDAAALDVNRFTLAAWVRYLPKVHDERWEVLEKAGAYWMNIRTDSRRLRAGAFFGGCQNQPGAKWRYTDSKTPLPQRQWTHVATTYDGAALRIYVNGVLDQTLAVSGATCVNTEALIIGAKVKPGAGISEAYFDGRIDDLRVYKRALSAAEIQRIKASALY